MLFVRPEAEPLASDSIFCIQIFQDVWDLGHFW